MTDQLDTELALDTLPHVQRHSREDANAFVSELEKQGYKQVRFEFCDMAGMSRGKTIPLPHVAGYMRNGLNFYGGTVALDSYSIPVRGSGYNEERNYSDCNLILDKDSVTPVPWLDRTCRVLCDTLWYDDTPQMAVPRLLLKKMLKMADDLGFTVKMGHEFEFYAVDAETRQPLFPGQPIFATDRTHQFQEIEDLIEVFGQQGIDIITYNVEHGPGQIEINYDADDGIRSADRAFIFKSTVKEYLRRRGINATFMTKPYKGLSGSCSHFHISLLSKSDGSNAFFDPEAEHGMSALCRGFTQGVLDHARASMAIWSPTPNCYRRIRPRTYAPSNISWGVEDRTASVRIKASGDERTHIEVRVPSAMSNPYLTAASVLATGLLGAVQRRELVPQGQGPKEDDDAFQKLPTEIWDALDALESDTALCDVLGEEFIQVYLAMKRQEAQRLRDEIPPAETAEYFEQY
ncbi:MAG: glutamine synthetase family protein [Pseudomonadota bacterium]